MFMVDPDISSHSMHEEKAKRFGMECSTNTETGDCVEFPKNPRSILAVVRLLYTTQVGEKPSMRNTSIISNTTVDSGIVKDDQSASSVHIVDYSQISHARLTRGESSLPPCGRLSWSSNSEKTTKKAERKPSSSTDEGSRLSPRALFSSNQEAAKKQSEQSETNFSFPTKPQPSDKHLSSGIMSHQKLHGESSLLTAQERNVVMLSQQNLIRHDNRMKQSGLVSENSNNNSRVPPPMHKLSMGKYRIPDGHNLPGDSRRYEKKHQTNKASHGTGKRNRIFHGRFVTLGKVISRSTENVAMPDEDGLSGASSVESLASNASLPSCMNGAVGGNFDHGYQRSSLRASQSSEAVEAAGRISHWAVSFERLLEDPLGVIYFKEFLRKEFSEENILFWEASDKLRRTPSCDSASLRQQIQDIYDRFLSPTAVMPVNIDSHGQQLAEEALTIEPHPDIFINQQNQVYTLMKLDSYSRFLKSTLYRQCMVAEMEGRTLPLDVGEDGGSDVASFDGSSLSRPASRSLDAGTLRRKGDMVKRNKSSRKGLFGFKNRSKTLTNRSSSNASSLSRGGSSRESSGSEGHSNLLQLTRSGSLPLHSITPDFPDSSRVCHVTLWDGSTTVLYAKKPGSTTIEEVIGNMSERRGVRLRALDVFLVEDGDDGRKRRPMMLDLDVSVLAGQSIVLERRSLFRLDMPPVQRSVGVKARPTKPIDEVLRPVLQKYNLHLEDMEARNSADNVGLNLKNPVSTLDGMRIVVDNKKGELGKEKVTRNQPQKSYKSTIPDKQETEELISLMSSLQSSTMHDQRGLISKAHLELPEFLKLKPTPPSDEKNVNANNNVMSSMTSSGVTSSTEPSPYAVSYISDINTQHRSKPVKQEKGYVELNARPKLMSTFKPSNPAPPPNMGSKPPIPPHPQFLSRGSTPSPVDDLNDTTIVEDPDQVNFDPELTLLPSPTHKRELQTPDYTPPPPVGFRNEKDESTIMV
nr:regulator of G-protein signaling 12 isoform X1 [Ciona intestinalis]|eukprot:XP_009860293.2 regulator of G-protein signaling 12 isoform X1 [Ciona intestinalis]